MVFSRFKTAFKKVSKGKTLVFYRKDGTYWVGTDEVLLECSQLSEAEQTILHRELEQVTRNTREVDDLQPFINRWTDGKLVPANRTKVLWDKCVMLTSEHGTCGVQEAFLDVVERLIDTDTFTLDWGGKRDRVEPLRVTHGERLIGFIAPVMFDGRVRSVLEEVAKGLPSPIEIGA